MSLKKPRIAEVIRPPWIDTKLTLKKIKSSPYLKYIERFKELALSPYALPKLENRALSPLSRAERVLKKPLKNKNKPEIKLDSSIEASLEKIYDVENVAVDKNEKFLSLFSSSKSSDKIDHEDLLNAHNENLLKLMRNPPSSPEERNRKSKSITANMNKHESTKSDQKGSFSKISTRTAKNFFYVRKITQKMKFNSNKDNMIKTARTPFHNKQKLKEVKLIESVCKDASKTPVAKYTRNQSQNVLPYIASSVLKLDKLQSYPFLTYSTKNQHIFYNTKEQNGQKYAKVNINKNGPISPTWNSNFKFAYDSTKNKSWRTLKFK